MVIPWEVRFLHWVVVNPTIIRSGRYMNIEDLLIGRVLIDSDAFNFISVFILGISFFIQESGRS